MERRENSGAAGFAATARGYHAKYELTAASGGLREEGAAAVPGCVPK